MDILLLAFANNREHPLPTLTEEYAAINKTLSPSVLQQHFLSWAISHATLDDIAYYLTLFRDRLRLFQFSGHAGRDSLMTEDGSSRAGGIAHLLGQCKQLQIVILNGCSTKAQVEALHEAGIPLVIATSAPVEDDAATRFSRRFYQAMEAGQSVGEAFEMAVGEVKAKQDVVVHRGLALREVKPEAPLWGIFSHPDKPDAQDWKLPTQATAPATPQYEPNEELLETLYETFAQTNPPLQELEEMGATTDMQREEIISALLKALPAPISEQIRKLLVPSGPGTADGYDQVGMMRLQQIAQAYQITMDFLVFTLLAQIWDLAQQPGWQPSPQLRQAMTEYFNLSAEERQDFDYFTFIKILRDAFPEQAPTLFVKELDGLQQAFLQREDIENACFFLETLRRQLNTVSVMELGSLCSRAEDALATIFSQLGYLGRYILATIRNIAVHKYRHAPDTEFEHLLMKWHGMLGIYQKERRRRAIVMDNRSVVLLRVGDTAEDSRFLSLSPFVIDENTFEEVPDLSISKLYFFSHREKDHIHYKYVNAPEEDIIDLDDPAFYIRKQRKSKFHLAKEQFEAFYEQIVEPQKPVVS